MLWGCSYHRIHQQTAVGVRDTQVCVQVSAVPNQDQKIRNLNILKVNSYKLSSLYYDFLSDQIEKDKCGLYKWYSGHAV